MNYPNRQDYIEIFSEISGNRPFISRNPKIDILQKGTFVSHNDGGNKDIIWGEGQYAYVLQCKSDDDHVWAVRCPKVAPVSGLARRMSTVNQLKQDNQYVNDLFLETIYIEGGLNWKNEKYDIGLMEWVDGVSLDRFIRYFYKNRDFSVIEKVFACLFDIFIAIQDAGLAHGDISPQNIIVDLDGRVKLIDYDSIYHQSLADLTLDVLGKKGFIFPIDFKNAFNQKNPSGMIRPYGPYMDNFACVTLLMSIRLIPYISDMPTSVLVFSQDDLNDIDSSVVFNKLKNTQKDEYTERLFHKFSILCKGDSDEAFKHPLKKLMPEYPESNPSSNFGDIGLRQDVMIRIKNNEYYTSTVKGSSEKNIHPVSDVFPVNKVGGKSKVFIKDRPEIEINTPILIGVFLVLFLLSLTLIKILIL